MFATAALLLGLLGVGGLFARNEPLEVSTFIDAGPAPALAIQVPDAGPEDAGQLAAMVEPVDAGIVFDRFPPALETLGTKGTFGGPKKPLRKPVSKTLKSKAPTKPLPDK